MEYSATAVQVDGRTMYLHKVTVWLSGSTPSIDYVEVRGNEGSGLSAKRGLELLWDLVPTRVSAFQATIQVKNFGPMGVLCNVGNEAAGSQEFTLSTPSALAPEPGVPTTVVDPVGNTKAPRSRTGNDGYLRAVMLFTDGEANQGIVNVTELAAAVRTCVDDSPSDFVVFTFGFGVSHNTEMLKQIADATQGSYSFVRTPEGIPATFGECLGGLMSVVCTKLQVGITLRDGVDMGRVWTAFPVQSVSPRAYTVNIKDLYSEEQRDILLKLKIPSVGQVVDKPSQTAELMTVTLSCENAVTGQADTTTSVVRIIVTPGAYVGPPNSSVEEQECRMIMMEALENAKRQGQSSNVDGARATLEEAKARITTATCSGSDYTKRLLAQLSSALALVSSNTGYTSAGGGAALCSMLMCQAQQRSNCCCDAECDDECGMYANTRKREMKARAQAYR